MLLRTLSIAAVAALPFIALPPSAEAGCTTRDRMSNCFEPRGNDALSVQPNRKLLKMPEIDPQVTSPRLRKLKPPLRADRRQPNLLRWNKRGPDGRIITRRCIGLSCGPFIKQP